MNPQTQQFRALHDRHLPLRLPNAWDAASAKLCERAGAGAVGTSSAAVAWALGYADGGALPVGELLGAVKHMLRVLSVPLTVDVEHGYSDDPIKVSTLIAELASIGTAGINMEDGVGDPALLVKKIAACRSNTEASNLFINARTDVFLQALVPSEHRITETISRALRYLEAGADGIFVPALRRIDDIHPIARAISAPLNVMAVPGLPPIQELASAGVARISFGPAMFQRICARASADAIQSVTVNDVNFLFEDAISFNAMNDLFVGKH